MRYTWIDGMYVTVNHCSMCPFFSTELELNGYCRYPHAPANKGDAIDMWGDSLQDDCPLRSVG